MALAAKAHLSLSSKSGIESATKKFLEGCDWLGMTQTRIDCCKSWTDIFATKEVTFEEPVINNFLEFVDHMSCSAETYTSFGGSNGCADQFTNWDGTKKRGLGIPDDKNGRGLRR